VHNPRGSRFYFPGGGEIGYLVVDAAHRGRGLGSALVATALARLTSAGYRHVWLGTLAARWQSVFDALGRPADPSAWPRELRELRELRVDDGQPRPSFGQ
jgi:GNAT superfamily N-acetyltransferase